MFDLLPVHVLYIIQYYLLQNKIAQNHNHTINELNNKLINYTIDKKTNTALLSLSNTGCRSYYWNNEYNMFRVFNSLTHTITFIRKFPCCDKVHTIIYHNTT